MNKKVLIVGYGELREFIYSTLNESGQIDLYLITNDSEIVNTEYFKEVYVVDTNDFISVSAFVSSLNIEFDFIVTFREPFVLLASYLQNCFCNVKSSLGGVLRSSANKYLMRKTLEGKDYSVKTVSLNLESLDLFKESLLSIKFPCVVKPKSGYRSLGVYKINNNLEVLDVYDKVINDIKKGNLALSSEYQAEEFIGGEMYSADGFVLNGEFSEILLTKQLLGLEPYFI